jgi:hypothetical protein
MRPTLKAILAAGTLALVGGLGIGVNSAQAQAQAIGGGVNRGGFTGYYYSPGGYSGGYYFRPGYYPNPTSTAYARYTAGSSALRSASRATGGSPDHYDQSTGRTNLSIPLSKPWLRPLR